jgi:hypothetical protein
MLHTPAPAMTLVISTVALAVGGCGYDPLDPSTQSQPARGAVVGTWVLDEEGRAGVRAAVKKEGVPTLILKEDGTFSARDIPDWWNHAGRLEPRTHWVPGPRWTLWSGSGTWFLIESGNAWVVMLGLPGLRGDARGFMEMQLYNQKPPYRLGVILGDPDEGQSLIFERTGPAPGAGTVP